MNDEHKPTTTDPALKAQIERELKAIDWHAFWARVQEKVEPQIEAYRLARARSEARMRHRWLRAAA